MLWFNLLIHCALGVSLSGRCRTRGVYRERYWPPASGAEMKELGGASFGRRRKTRARDTASFSDARAPAMCNHEVRLTALLLRRKASLIQER